MRNKMIYGIWKGMLSRCLNPDDDSYHRYGGRGITVCQAWRDSIDTFARDVGQRPSIEHSLDRVDNNGNYEPGNVRWATRTQQQHNRRDNVMLTMNGVTKTVSEWSRETGIHRRTITRRIRSGVPSELILKPGSHLDPIRMAVRKQRLRDGIARTHEGRAITINGITKLASEWAEESGLSIATIRDRVSAGYVGEEIVCPIKINKNRNTPKSGLPYVYRMKPKPGMTLHKPWQARITRKGVKVRAPGMYATPEEAYAALQHEAQRLGVDFRFRVSRLSA
jgi:hypothetical protein